MSSKPNKIFESDSNSETEDFSFSTNSKFAKSYDKSQQKQLLKKLKKRELESEESSSSESDESEEDDGFADEDFDKTFFNTLASIKARDPKIYEKNVEFFGEVDLSTRKRSKEDKPITIRDLERKVLVEHGGMFEEVESRKAGPSVAINPITEEQKEDKAMFHMDESDEEEETDLFKSNKVEVREKKSSKVVNPEIMKPMKVFWDDPNISKEEAHLRDYITKRKFGETADDNEDDQFNLSEDEEDLEKQEEFEQKVNFRYEEQDQDFIKRFPRTIATSVRNVDDKRKKKRADLKERKAREKEERKKEIEKLKELKKQEIEEKISKLKQVSGSESIPFDDADLSDDFDPDEYDRKMQEIFNDEYYGIDEGEDKPECPDIEDLKVQDWDNYNPNEDEDDATAELHCDDPDFNMDCEYDPKEAKKQFEKEIIESTQSRKRRKRRSRFAEVLRKEKPTFNPEDEKTYAEYIDEYYKLDCEDVIGDVKCRFKYVETVPNDFGLTVEEILMAKNKELNKWASLKKAVQIRPKNVEMNEVQQYDRRRQNWFLKKQILRSVYGEGSEDEEEGPKNLISSTKLHEKPEKTEEVEEENKMAATEAKNENISKKKKKKKPPVEETQVQILETSDPTSEMAAKKKKKPKKDKPALSQQKIEAPDLPSSKKNKKRKAEDSLNEKQDTKTPAKKFKFDNKSRTKNTPRKNEGKKKSTTELIDYETSQGKFAINAGRLMAFGINPKKFRSKVKYGNQNDTGKRKNKQKKNKKKPQKQSN